MKTVKVIFALLFSTMLTFTLMANVNVWKNEMAASNQTRISSTQNNIKIAKYTPGTVFNLNNRKEMVRAEEYVNNVGATIQSIGTPIYPSEYTVEGTPLTQTSANGITNTMTLLQDSSGQYYLGYAYYADNQWFEQNLLTVPQNIFSGTIYIQSAAFYNTNSPFQYGFAVLTDTQFDQNGFMCINGTWTSPLGDMPNLNNQATNIYVNGSGDNAALVIGGNSSFSVISYAQNNWNLTTLPSSITNISEIAFDWASTGSGEYLSAAVLAQNGIYQIVSGQTSTFEKQDTLNSGAFTNMTLPTFNAYTGELSSVIVQTNTSQGNPNNFLLESAENSGPSSGSNISVLDLGTWTLPWLGLPPTSPIVQNALVPIALGTYSSIYQNSNLSNNFTPSQTIAAISTLNSSNTYNTWLWTQNDGWTSIPLGINTATSQTSASLYYSSSDSFSGSTLTFNNINVFLQGPNNNVLTNTEPYSSSIWTSVGPQTGEKVVIGEPSNETKNTYPSLKFNGLYLWVESDGVWQVTPYGYSQSGGTPTLGLVMSNFEYSICGNINWTNGTVLTDMGVSSAVIAITELSSTGSELNCKLYDFMQTSPGASVGLPPTDISLQSTNDEISQIQSTFDTYGNATFTAIETSISSGAFEYAFLGSIVYSSTKSQFTPYISTPITLSSLLSGRYTLLSSNIFQTSTPPPSPTPIIPKYAVIELSTGDIIPHYSFYYLTPPTTSSVNGTIVNLGSSSSNAWNTYSPTSYYIDCDKNGNFEGIAVLVNDGSNYHIYSYGSDTTGMGTWNQFSSPLNNPLNLNSKDAYILSSVSISSSGGIDYININDPSGKNAYNYNNGTKYITIPQETNSLDVNGNSTIYTITAVGPYGSSLTEPHTGTWPDFTSLPSDVNYELYQVTVNTPSSISFANMLAGDNGYYCYADISGLGWSSTINQYGFPINGFTINSNGITPNKYVFYIVAPTQVTVASAYSDAYTVTFSEADMAPNAKETWGYNSTLSTSTQMLLPIDVPPPTSVTSPTKFIANYQSYAGGVASQFPTHMLVLDPNGVCAVPVQIELESGTSSTSYVPLPSSNQYYDKITFELQVINTSASPTTYSYYSITESPSSNSEGIYMQPTYSGVSPQYGYTSIPTGQTTLPEGDYRTFYFYSSKSINNTASSLSAYNIIPIIQEGNVLCTGDGIPVTSNASSLLGSNSPITTSQAYMTQSNDTWQGEEYNLQNPGSSLISSNCLWNPYHENGSITPNYLFSKTISTNKVFYDTSTGSTPSSTAITMDNLTITPTASATIQTPTNPLFFVFPEGINEQTLSQRIDTANMPISVWPDDCSDNNELTNFVNMNSYTPSLGYPNDISLTTANSANTWEIPASTNISPLSFISFDDTVTNNSLTSNINNPNNLAIAAYMFAFTQYGDPVGEIIMDDSKNKLFNAKYTEDLDTESINNYYPMHLLLSNNDTTLKSPLLFTASTPSTPASPEGINAAGLLNNTKSEVLIPYGDVTDIVTMNNATPPDTTPKTTAPDEDDTVANQYQINIASPLNPRDTLASSTLTDTAMLRGKSYFNMTTSPYYTSIPASSNAITLPNGTVAYNCTFTCGLETNPADIFVNGSSTDTLASELIHEGFPSLSSGVTYVLTVKEKITSLSNESVIDPLNTIWTYYAQDDSSTVKPNVPPCLEWAVEADNQTDADAQTRYYDLDLQISPTSGSGSDHYSVGYDFANEEIYTPSPLPPQPSPYSSGDYYALVGTRISAVATGVQDTNNNTIQVPLIGVMVNNQPLDGINNTENNDNDNIIEDNILNGACITALDLNAGTETISTIPANTTNLYTPLGMVDNSNAVSSNTSFHFGSATDPFESPVTGCENAQSISGSSIYTPWAFSGGTAKVEYYPYNPISTFLSNITL